MDTQLDVRPSPIAGQWYPGQASVLAAQVDAFLNQAHLDPLPGEVLAVVSPHAGYMYSGAVAGYAFAALRGRSPELVAVLSPMHHPYPGQVFTTAHQAYTTPLGLVPVDTGALEALQASLTAHASVSVLAVRHDPEHALEIELPFLQRALADSFHLLPLMLRDLTPAQAQAVGQALAEVLKERQAVLVASSDLSHYYPQAIANRLDAEMLRRIEALDPQAVLAAEREGVGFACGRTAIAVTLWAAQALGADGARVLRYATSGDVTGDFNGVVGYGAVAIFRRG